jgi:hypothetical protein
MSRIAGTLASRWASSMTRIGKRVEIGLMAVGKTLLEESKKLVPSDTNYLMETARVTKFGSGLRTLVIVGYGGKDFPSQVKWSKRENRYVFRRPCIYTVYVHELGSPRDPRPTLLKSGQPNFLGEPRYTKIPEMQLALRVALA